MNTTFAGRTFCHIFLSLPLLYLLFSCQASAQNNRAVMGEMATCKITVSNISGTDTKSNSLNAGKGANTDAKENKKTTNNTYQLKPNQLGFFDQVSGIQPQQVVPVEISYSQGKPGEKVLVTAEDGGRFENGKMISLSQLDTQKKVSFNFQLSDQPGIFHIRVQKGNDIKVIRLWVGPDPFSNKN